MKTSLSSKALIVGMLLTLVGCSGMKTMQKEVDELKAQMAAVRTEAQSARAAADAAAAQAQSAGQEASGAQSTANQALAATQSSQACCNAVDEKLDRAFRQSVSK